MAKLYRPKTFPSWAKTDIGRRMGGDQNFNSLKCICTAICGLKLEDWSSAIFLILIDFRKMGFVERKTHFPCFLLKWVLLEKKPFQQNPFSLLFVDMGFVEKRFCWKKTTDFNKTHFPSSSESEEFRRPISNPEKARQMEKASKKKRKQKGVKKQRGWKVRGEID